MTHYVVSYSGGIGSWAAAKLTLDRIAEPPDEITLLFADTLIEDEDTYRFLDEGAAALGLPVTRIADGRTPFEVFKDVRFLANHRLDPCSRILKRDLLDKWCRDNAPGSVRVVGIDWTEDHRLERLRKRHPGVKWIAPLITFNVDKPSAHRMAANAGLQRQRLYEMGMPHANCGGGCVKMGQAGWERVYRSMPEQYARWEAEEEKMRQFLDKDIAFMTDRSGGSRRPLTLTEFRQRIEVQPGMFDGYDWGGCGCAIE